MPDNKELPIVRSCRECGEAFTAFFFTAKYCDTCKLKRDQKKGRKRGLPVRKKCYCCHEEFMATMHTVKLCNKCKVYLMKYDAHRLCTYCNHRFVPVLDSQWYCSKFCEAKADRRSALVADALCSVTKGAVGELLVAADLLSKGWSVFRAMSAACFCDLVAYRDGKRRFIEVRTGTIPPDGKIEFNDGARPGTTEFAVCNLGNREIRYIEIEPVKALDDEFSIHQPLTWCG